MVDLISQYAAIEGEVDQAIKDVIQSAAFINGPEVKSFCENLGQHLNAKHVIGCANGTDALQIVFMALDLQPGDEVIVPAFTYVALAEMIALLRLKPVFVDVDLETFNIDPEKIEAAISPSTKVIAPVHLFGQNANMEPIMDLAKKHGLYVVEDNAQAIGSDYLFSNGTVQKSGTIGHFGTTSFFPSKNLGCYGDGGAVFTNDDALAERARMIANHGQEIKYYHKMVGINSRLDSLQAAILNVKLKHLNTYVEKRREVAQHYDRELADNPRLILPSRSKYSSHVFHQYTLRLMDTDREALRGYLSEKGIPSMVYYPLPLHKQEAYRTDQHFPNAELLATSVLSLPISSEMNQDQLNYITTHLNTFFDR